MKCGSIHCARKTTIKMNCKLQKLIENCRDEDNIFYVRSIQCIKLNFSFMYTNQQMHMQLYTSFIIKTYMFLPSLATIFRVYSIMFEVQ
jgi:hypothetical protein